MAFIPSPYHTSRGNYKPEIIVIHTCVGTYQGTINYFKKNDRQVSAHYVIKEDGSEYTQMVAENRSAGHAGIVDRPNFKLYKPNVNPNLYTIGIENADNVQPATWDRTKQTPPLAKLVREIALRNNIPIDRDHIINHRQIRASKTCPGNLDVDLIVKLAREEGDEEVITDQTKIPQIVDENGNPMEVQRIRSELNDQKNTIQSLRNQLQQAQQNQGDPELKKKVEAFKMAHNALVNG